MAATAERCAVIAIIGGGPAGLMAAEAASKSGARVDVYDAMPSVGRKFLMAGKGGLNLTHAEPRAAFLSRYGDRRPYLKPLLADFGPAELRAWARGLGVDTFAGSSGRIFPADMKAAPLLRAWLHRLRAGGVNFHVRHRWCGWDADGMLKFATPQGERAVHAGAAVLALGGGSWARLGSTGAWVPMLAARGVRVAPLRPANCGFDVGWSEHFRAHHAGHPVKAVVAAHTGPDGVERRQKGEFVITATGVEGGLIYTLSARLRDAIETAGAALLRLDLAPGRDLARLARVDVLILDDWGLAAVTDVQRQDLLEVMEDRDATRSTIITSQLPRDQWHAYLSDPTIADAVLDRLVHNAYAITLKGPSRRKEKA